MITQQAYELARKEIKTFADAGPNDTQMTLEMAKALLLTKLEKPSKDNLDVHYFAHAVCAAIIYRYEEQNNLYTDSPTNPVVTTNNNITTA